MATALPTRNNMDASLLNYAALQQFRELALALGVGTPPALPTRNNTTPADYAYQMAAMTKFIADNFVAGARNVAGGYVARESYIRTTDGEQVLLEAAEEDRKVIVTVIVDTTFANGDGGQPTFTIGETGALTKFAAAAAFTNAAAGRVTMYGGTLDADDELIVDATAATGTTSTGAITVTVQVVPEI